MNKKVKIGIIITAAMVVAVSVLVIAAHVYYGNRWYANTWIGEHELSGMSYDESEQLLQNVYDNYKLEIKGRNDGKLVVTKADISYEVDLKAALQKQYDAQHESFSVFSIPKKKTLELHMNPTYDAEKLNKCLKKSEMYKGSTKYAINVPKDAKVVFSDEKKCLVVVPEDKGNVLQFQQLTEAVDEALAEGKETIDLANEEEYPEVYESPEIFSDDAALKQKLDACNPYVMRWVSWKITDGRTEKVGPKLIYSWLRYKNGKVSFNDEKMSDWVEKMCLKYKTVGSTHTFTNHKGKQISVAGGDYGWAISYEETLKQLKKALNTEIDAKLQSAYQEDPTKENQAAITLKRKTKFANTAYQMDFENKTNDWDTQNFTEISLKDQKIYVWRKGKVVFECETISGRPVEGRKTRTGMYFIKEHQTHRVLKGDNYRTPVTYWVRITWTGTGFHCATWQPWSRWSKDLYKTRGSHGCLNLSPENSKKIYELTKYQEAVFIY